MGKFTDPVGKHFEFPDSLLKQISECTGGNFCLFYVDSEGCPDVRGAFENPVNEMGLRTFASKYLMGINESENMQFIRSNMDDGDGDSGCGDYECKDCYPDDDE